ncbi:MAG TPA: hypothetical protein VGC91_15015 [Pyrinomonadaceae bacterium]|jgi:hypothetical protein
MKQKFPSALAALLLLLLMLCGAQAQEKPPAAPQATGGAGKVSTPTATNTVTATSNKIVITATTSPMDLAHAAYLAQGGDKARNLKNMVVTGSVDLFAPNSLQSVPGKFAMVTAGERSRIEIQSPVITIRQISDGTRNYSSVPQVQFPDPNKFGLRVLMRYNQSGYVVSALPDNKKLRCFRITDPEGNVTDFSVDLETGRVMSFVIPYNGLVFGQENKSFKEIDGVLVPYNFTQRLEMRQGAAYADFKSKDVKLNIELGEDMFEIPEQK